MIDKNYSSQSSTEWFTRNLPEKYLTFPDHYLYETLLSTQELEDIKEIRGEFKKLLTERRIEESIPLPATADKEMEQFLNDPECKLERSRELLALASKYLSEGKDLVEAQRLALEQIFHREAPLHQAEMDEAYFTNRELVEADLRKYLAQTDKNSTEELSTGTPKASTRMITSNGKKITWGTYLNRASGILLGTKKNTDNPHRKADALKELKRICGIEVIEYDEMDEAYFRNPEKVKYDLEQFLAQTDRESIKEFSLRVPDEDVSIIAFNSERVTWNTYIVRTSRALFGTDNKKNTDNPHRKADALKELKRICGIEVKEYDEMDEAYFRNPEKVRYDLEQFLAQTDRNSIDELKTASRNILISITASNNEKVTFQAYLNRASGVLLGTESNSKNNFHRNSDALKELKRICGIEVIEYDEMDEAYFRNPEKVRYDLEAFLEYAKGGSIANLSTGNPKYNKPPVFTSNGEQVLWGTYLNRASSILLNTQSGSKDNPHRGADALKELKRICGIEVIEYDEMDEAYFRNPEKVKYDLNQFLKRAKKIKSISEINTSNPSLKTKAVTSNGEQVLWGTYLNRASSILLNTQSGSKDSLYRKADALKELKRICGIEVKEYDEMDEAYFRNPEKVKYDLEQFLAQTDRNSIDELKAGSRNMVTPIIASNGEQVLWGTYLNRASSILLNTQSGSKDNPHRGADALKELKRICGIEVIEYDEMDEAYFRNPEKVKYDLNQFLKRAKKIKSISEINTSNPSLKTKAVTSNGEQVLWGTYLNRASSILLNTQSGSKDSLYRKADALKELKRICGIEVKEYDEMDEAYFRNPEKVKYDLEQFLAQTDRNSIDELKAGSRNMVTPIIASNGEQVLWGTYLNRASSILLNTQFGSKDNPHRGADALKELKRICGIEVIEYDEMDEAYFRNPEKVRYDLEAFLEYAKGDSIANLSTGNPRYNQPSVFISNGKKIKWQSYLSHASGILLNTEFDSKDNPHRKADALKELKRICGIEVIEYDEMDEAYFRNPEKVKYDLEQFLAQTDKKSIDELFISTPSESTPATISNGENLKWNTYLVRASKILFGTKSNSKENPHRKSDVLKRLKEIAVQAEQLD